jgi:hypothetical protein
MKNFLIKYERSRKAMNVVIAIIKGKLEISKGAIGDAVTVRDRFKTIWISISTKPSGI